MTKAADGKTETAGLKDTLNAVVGASGGNIDPLKKEVKSSFDRVEKLKEERAAINDKIGSIRSNLQAQGIHKQAFDMAMKYMNMDADKREGFDIAYDICREALGEPFEPTLFDNDGKPAIGDAE